MWANKVYMRVYKRVYMHVHGETPMSIERTMRNAEIIYNPLKRCARWSSSTARPRI